MKREDILFLCHSNPETIVDLIENLNDHIESPETELNDVKSVPENICCDFNR
jgi:hypothetical protein